MRHIYDKGETFLKDFERVVNDARRNQPSLVVVPTEREVKTFESNFKSMLDGEPVFCCSFADYYDGSWMMLKPRPKHIYGFRNDDIWRNVSADAIVEYVTSKGSKKFKKEEETS